MASVTPGLQCLVPDQLWIADMEAHLLGFRHDARMTVIRLPDGGLWLHSPVALTPELRRDLDAAGPVRCLVSPSRFHYQHVPEYARAYLQAKVYAVPGSAKALKGVAVEALLDEDAPPEWAGILEQAPLRGSWLYDEVDFFHPATRTLILTDLCFFIPEDRPLLTRLPARMWGILGRFSSSRSFRLSMRDRDAARRSVERLLEWDFDRVIISHGNILETGGKEAFRQAFDWLLPGKTGRV
jgi:hypothetical protein